MPALPSRLCDVTQTERHSRGSVVADVEDDAATVSGPTAQLTAVRPHTLPDSPPVNIGLWHTRQSGILAFLSPLAPCRTVPNQHRIMAHPSKWDFGIPVATRTPAGQSPVSIGLWHTCQRGIMTHLSPLVGIIPINIGLSAHNAHC